MKIKKKTIKLIFNMLQDESTSDIITMTTIEDNTILFTVRHLYDHIKHS
jgi:hypothetical protein